MLRGQAPWNKASGLRMCWLPPLSTCRPRPPPLHFRRGRGRRGAPAGRAGGGGIGWARLCCGPATALPVTADPRPACLPANGAMGNCHTVGPNEALVVSGEGKARGGMGKGRRGVRVPRTHLSQPPPESGPPSHSTASGARPLPLLHGGFWGFQCWDSQLWKAGA